MKRYILKRIGQGFVCLLGVTIVIFFLTRISGDPVLLMIPPEATQEDIQQMRQVLGLDKPMHIQYAKFISRAVIGDFGRSIRWKRPTLEVFMEVFPNTLQLAFAATAFALFVGIPVGVLSAVMVGRWFDNFGKVFALLGQAIPVFWMGILFILIFSVHLRLLPTSGIGDWRNLLMPAVSLGWLFTAAMVRLSRSAMLDALDSEYIKMERIMGLPEFLVIGKYALKNSFIPILTMGAANFVILLNGTVVTETVFNWPGIGRLIVDSIMARDFPMVQTCVLISSALYIFVNLFVDILYAYIDPRIRYQ